MFRKRGAEEEETLKEKKKSLIKENESEREQR